MAIAGKARELTESAGARFAGAVVNKLRSDDARIRVIQKLERRGVPVLGGLQFSERLLEDGLFGRPVNWEEAGIEAGVITDGLMAFFGLSHHP